jgi:hypothetical protein
MRGFMVLGVLASGCAHSVWAEFDVTSETGTVVKARVATFVGDPNGDFERVEIDDGEVRVARGSEASALMDPINRIGQINYWASFDDVEPGEVFTFEVEYRGTIHTATASLPEPFDIASPVPMGETTGDISVTWAPSGFDDPVRASLYGDCADLGEADFDVEDSGEVVLAWADLGFDGELCETRLQLWRERAGTLPDTMVDNELASASGQQMRVVDFVARP